MHTFSETGAGVPAFLAKLWRLVEDTETNNLICWNKDGRSFIIQNQAQFARELLPLNYKHNNMASFIRQLNMYGFHKITSIDNGGLKFDRDEMEFSHPCFKRNCPYLLEHIKRKIANTKTIDEKATIKPEAVSKVLSDVKAMRGRQDSLDSRFSVMKQENEALWREIASLRQKHVKQQQIVNKLIQFLITIVQPSRNMTGVKRNVQLMINDTPEQARLRKASESGSESGPVIHELGEDLFEDINENDSDLGGGPSSPYVNLASVESSRPDNDSPQPRADRPKSNVSTLSHTFDYSNQSADDVLNQMGNATPGSPAVINTVNPDGSQIVYHVTEVPDSVPATPESFVEETHIATPMVKEMTRNRMIKMKNKRKSSSSTVTKSSTSTSPAAKMLRTGDGSSQLRIKTEETESDIDPLMFLNANYPSTDSANTENLAGPSIAGNNASANDVNLNTAMDSRLISPQTADSQKPMIVSNHDADMYTTNDFITDMPTDLFEESPMIDNTNLVSGNNKYDYRSKPSFSGKQQTQLQSLGKISNYGGPSLSSKNLNLQLAKVNNSNNEVGENMRLSALDEVNTHLDGVQDDLDTLKDLLRGDGYSLDANTLLGNGTSAASRIYLPPQLEADIFNKLFNDSDILGPYGLSLSADNSQDRKGSELMAYHQPMYDLSDIMDINDKNNDTNNDNADSSKQLSESNSVLNTPYHD